jgi:mannose-6-phosphate isomerase class I
MSDIERNNKIFGAPLPEEMSQFPRGLFEAFPAFTPTQGNIQEGYPALIKNIQSSVPAGLRVLIVDGYQGIDWQSFRAHLASGLDQLSLENQWLNMRDCFLPAEQIHGRISPFLGSDDPIFGTHFPLGMELFFDPVKIADFRIQAAMARGAKTAEKLTVIYGCGAGLLELWDRLWYLDIPKDIIQYRARQNKAFNLAESQTGFFEEFYKRAYFVEWPALNRLKRELLPYLDALIDLSDPELPSMISGPDFRKTLQEIAESPFRVRPWFFPGPWGGKFMQGHMGLDPKQPNYAWSYELIVPENGIMLEKEGKRLEFSFDFLMFQEHRRILGDEAAKQFKYEWPIRLDYLDTIDGGNLSTQCHPRPNYMRQNFGETFTQDESYYISNAKNHARVYIGLNDDCDPEEFRKNLEKSQDKGVKVDLDRFVNSEPSQPHDLFLIPNGTVHCSGRGNLVLEISATPYIFTFKIYDYLRKDLDGKFRPLNIERGFDNIYTHRRKKWVQENLLAKPRLLRKGEDWQEYVLYDGDFFFYNIHRAEFRQQYHFDTQERGYAVNLVEGEQVEVSAENGRNTRLSYLESMIVPAAAGKVKIENKGERPCKLVLVFVKPGIGVSAPLNDPSD